MLDLFGRRRSDSISRGLLLIGLSPERDHVCFNIGEAFLGEDLHSLDFFRLVAKRGFGHTAWNHPPSVSHLRWSNRSVANRIVRWVRNISEGKEDTHQTLVKTEFIEGGTVGPVVGGRSQESEK